MPAFSDNLLIKADGTIDEAYLQAAAVSLARSRYGVDCTDGDIACRAEMLRARAIIMRARKLRELGLPADPVFSIAAYGNVPDGVRRSAF